MIFTGASAKQSFSLLAYCIDTSCQRQFAGIRSAGELPAAGTSVLCVPSTTQNARQTRCLGHRLRHGRGPVETPSKHSMKWVVEWGDRRAGSPKNSIRVRRPTGSRARARPVSASASGVTQPTKHNRLPAVDDDLVHQAQQNGDYRRPTLLQGSIGARIPEDESYDWRDPAYLTMPTIKAYHKLAT